MPAVQVGNGPARLTAALVLALNASIRPSVGPGRLASFDATIGCLRRGGFSHALVVHALSTLDAYVDGFGAQRLHVAQAEVPDDVAMADVLASWLPAERHPYLSELVHEHVLVDGYDEEEAFDFGLEIVLEGLERRLAEPNGVV